MFQWLISQALAFFIQFWRGIFRSFVFCDNFGKVFLLFHFSFYLTLGYKKFLYRLFQESSWFALPTYSPFYNFPVEHNPSIKHCVKSVRIRSYSAPHFSRIFHAFSRIRTLFRQWRKMQCYRKFGILRFITIKQCWITKLFKHFRYDKPIRNIFQYIWISFKSSFKHLLGIIPIKNIH